MSSIRPKKKVSAAIALPVPMYRPLSYSSTVDIFARQEEYNRLEQAMDRLKPEHRDVIMLAKIEG